jgi:hypothetical protein
MTMTRPTTDQITHKGQLLSSVLDRAVNVLNYGAVGDGVTDDMDAFIAAFNVVKNAGGGTLYIPMTPNGYFLRAGTAFNVGNTSNISIISDGATLKLQGGTAAQVGSAAVISGSGPLSTNNLLIRGLRFVSASTVTRYLNGGAGGAIHFDPEVALGRADINEQCSFRYCISVSGPAGGLSENITIDDCYFGPGIFHGIDCKQGANPTTIQNVRLTNLTFEEVCQQCILINSVRNLVISDLVSINHRGSRFDWTLYTSDEIYNLTMSNITIRNDSRIDTFGTSGMQFLDGINSACLSGIAITNIANNALTIGGLSRNMSLSGISLKACGSPGSPAINITNADNISVSGITIDDCDWGANIVSRNVVFSDFAMANCTRGIAIGDGLTLVSNGRLSDCGGGTTLAAIDVGDSPGPTQLSIRNVDFSFDTFVPDRGCLDARGPTVKVDMVNCRMMSNFGTHTGSIGPVFANDGAIVRLAGCSTSGYAGPISRTFALVNTAVEELPALEPSLTINSATPSVKDSTLFVTANTSATALTNFTDGVQGQQICVRVNDANTTFDFSGTSLKGNNGVDYAASSGDVIFARRIGSNWYCTICQA